MKQREKKMDVAGTSDMTFCSRLRGSTIQRVRYALFLVHKVT